MNLCCYNPWNGYLDYNGKRLSLIDARCMVAGACYVNEEQMCYTTPISISPHLYISTGVIFSPVYCSCRDRDADLQRLLEQLQRLTPLTRLPLVAVPCTCRPTWRPAAEAAPPVTSSGASSSDDSDVTNSEDEEGKEFSYNI